MTVPTFGLADIPETWEIELHDSLVQQLDKYNRPWRYDGRQKGKNVYWPANSRAGRRMSEDPVDDPYKFYRRLWGYHRYKNGDNGAWIRKYQLHHITDHFNISEAELERAVIGLRSGQRSMHINSIKFPRLPLVADGRWARMFGFYYGAGSVRTRVRGKHDELVFRMSVHPSVSPLFEEAVKAVGDTPTVAWYEYDKPSHSDVYGTAKSVIYLLHRPTFAIMVKFGLDESAIYEARSGRTASNNIRPSIPTWIVENKDYMHEFLECYINTSRGGSIMHHSTTNHHLVLQILIKVCGRPAEDVEMFADQIRIYIAGETGTDPYMREELLRGPRDNVYYTVTLTNWIQWEWLYNNFEIYREDLRARLLIKIASKDDFTLREAAKRQDTVSIVILGMIYEQPQTMESLKAVCKVRDDRITASIIGLMNMGVIVKYGDVYEYEPLKFAERYMKHKYADAEILKKRMAKFGIRFLYQCQECNRVYTAPREKCGICQGKVKEVPRTKVLPSLHRRMAFTNNRAEKIKVQLDESNW